MQNRGRLSCAGGVYCFSTAKARPKVALLLARAHRRAGQSTARKGHSSFRKHEQLQIHIEKLCSGLLVQLRNQQRPRAWLCARRFRRNHFLGALICPCRKGRGLTDEPGPGFMQAYASLRKPGPQNSGARRKVDFCIPSVFDFTKIIVRGMACLRHTELTLDRVRPGFAWITWLVIRPSEGPATGAKSTGTWSMFGESGLPRTKVN